MDLENTPLEPNNEHQPPVATTTRLKLLHSVIVRAPGLLPMLYALAEVAEELDVSVQTVRGWVSHELPYQRDARGYIWIDGRKLAAWVVAARQPRTSRPLSADEAYCLKCRKPVALLNPVASLRGKRELWSGRCPVCGSSIHRGSRNDQSQ